MQQSSEAASIELENATTKYENLEKSQQVCGSLEIFLLLNNQGIIKASISHKPKIFGSSEGFFF